jgi:hypothetical protein
MEEELGDAGAMQSEEVARTNPKEDLPPIFINIDLEYDD